MKIKSLFAVLAIVFLAIGSSFACGKNCTETRAGECWCLDNTGNNVDSHENCCK